MPVKPRPLPTPRQQRLATRRRFAKARKAELAYARQLRHVARQVGIIVKGLAPKGFVRNMPQLSNALSQYAALLKPWAQSVAERMIAEVGNRDETAWAELGREIGRGLKSEIRGAPIGEAFRGLMDEQVDLITSLPLHASQRVHELVIRGMSGGVRAKESAKEILLTGRVTESRALLIARTETTRAASAMTQARAQHIGSEGYIWRTALDSDVRHEHKILEGKFIRWDTPPIASADGTRAHAGMIYNCRCYPEPVLPDKI